ncbi:hypothetical protein THTE_0666 [Thermogutta terrifontis]|uniref:Uncharacterized protein n=1 Tax=Thermogutta terrifontis TaxID=1331910 RepID=A0A286RBC8_9BACT|nr:hypothetical protein THTE_0666 [Thermogutta terrifontis]
MFPNLRGYVTLYYLLARRAISVAGREFRLPMRSAQLE